MKKSRRWLPRRRPVTEAVIRRDRFTIHVEKHDARIFEVFFPDVVKYFPSVYFITTHYQTYLYNRLVAQ
jgi:hypothetical protein